MDPNAAFRERANREFPVQRMPNFPNDQHIQRRLQCTCHLRCDYDSTARQPQHQISPNTFPFQILTQLSTGIFP